jgi:2-polyprenyl-6-methoxyphenol hydroxylase-like FAD-dependent oxidoreductase
MDQVDVVVIGCGVAGATTAGRLTLGGLKIRVLERATTFVDRVRGGFMPPWGVQEVFRLGPR